MKSRCSNDETHTIFLGFGSNLGERKQVIIDAIDWLAQAEDVTLICQSPLYESPALLPPNAPEKWDMPFFNAVAQFTTSRSPHRMLKLTQQAEERAGKITRGFWGPRELDVDVLSYDQLSSQSTALTLPHPAFAQRDFVLLPWRDIAPDWQTLPEGPTIAELAGRLSHITAKRLQSQVA